MVGYRGYLDSYSAAIPCLELIPSCVEDAEITSVNVATGGLLAAPQKPLEGTLQAFTGPIWRPRLVMEGVDDATSERSDAR